MDELRRLLTQRLDSVPGLLGLVISDRDGVPIIKASVEQSNVIEHCFRHQFLSVLSSSSELTSKLGIGQTRTVVSSVQDYQVVHCSYSPLVLTLIAEDSALTGQLLNFSQLLAPLIHDIAKIVVVD